MSVVKISAVGQQKREVSIEEGETLSNLFRRLDIEVPRGTGVEIWVNGVKIEDPGSHVLEADDSIVLMPNLKGQGILRE